MTNQFLFSYLETDVTVESPCLLVGVLIVGEILKEPCVSTPFFLSVVCINSRGLQCLKIVFKDG